MQSHDSAPYLITPSYLAGPDERGSTHVAEHLLHSGWISAPYKGGTVYAHRAERSLLEAVHIPEDAPAARGLCMTSGWEFAARRAPGQLPACRTYFCPQTPPELVTALATAITDPAPEVVGTPAAPPHYLRAPCPPEEATRPLAAAGWMRDMGRYEDAWYAPSQQAVVVTPLPPDPDGHGGANWLFAARRHTDNVALLHAIAHPHTPTNLIHALCAALTDPTPVPRQHLPAPDVGPVTVTHP
ncbi:DUF317 domain-containing protein [Streptomyces sp. NPDC002851]